MTETGIEQGSGPIGKEERTWAMACHLSALSGYFTAGLGSIVGPLVIWLIKKEDMPFVDEQGKEALNFQITIAIAAVVSVVLMIVVIGFLLFALLAIYYLVMIVLAAIKSNEGEHFRYPFTLRLIS